MGNRAKHRKVNPKSGKKLEKNSRIHFTKQTIEALPIPEDQPISFRALYRDDKTTGLALSVSPSGRKTFLLARWIRGRSEKVKLGTFPDMTVDQARVKAQRMNGQIAGGENPAEVRRGDMSLEELFQSWVTLYAKVNKKTWQDDQKMFDLYLHSWRFRKISEITRLDVVRLHRRIGETRGHYVANRIVELLSAMFNRASREWGWQGKNPAAAISAFKEKKRSRFLDATELPAFFKALSEEPDRRMRDFLLLALLCGGRRANIQAMQWAHIDWRRAVWVVPAEQSKNGEELQIVLVPMAVQLLAARKEEASKQEKKSPFVFPGTGVTGHIVEPKSCWARILKRAAVHQRTDWMEAHPKATEQDFERDVPHRFDDLRLHDLRRSLGSWMAGTGASLLTIGRGLGHESTESTQVYARLQVDPIRQAVERATNAMALTGGLAGLLPS